jgi:hypothetical protein
MGILIFFLQYPAKYPADGDAADNRAEEAAKVYERLL